MSSSVSFRITRTAEDLAQTITTLSQRLVKLEQRQEALELQVRQQLQSVQQVPDEERATLDGIEQLLQELGNCLSSLTPRPTTTLSVRSWPHKGGRGCQNKKKGNYGNHHSCLSCYRPHHSNPFRFS